MRTIEIAASDMKKIMNVCGSCVEKNEYREALQNIRIEIKNNTLKAIGCNGIKMAVVTINDIKSDDTEFYISPVTIKSKGLVIILQDDDGTITICDGDTRYVQKHLPLDYINYNSILQQSKSNGSKAVYLSASVLKPLIEALSKCKSDDTIKIEIGDTKRPAYIYANGVECLICTIKPNM